LLAFIGEHLEVAAAVVGFVVWKGPDWGRSVLALELAWEDRRERRAKAKRVNAPDHYVQLQATNNNGGAPMTDFDSLSNAAKLAHMSLSDHPHLNTPVAISTGPYGIEQVDAEGIATGLAELAATVPPQAVERADGWHLLSPA
jgi:hypothetical protein